MGSTDWADIFTEIGADPDAAQRRFLERERPRPSATRPSRHPAPVALGGRVRTSLWRQLSTLARRQVRLVVADRGYFLFLALMPFLVGLLPLAVAGHVGFDKPAADGTRRTSRSNPRLDEPRGDLHGHRADRSRLVGERAIFRREQAAGLSTSAYLVAKIAVFGAAAVAQSASWS